MNLRHARVKTFRLIATRCNKDARAVVRSGAILSSDAPAGPGGCKTTEPPAPADVEVRTSSGWPTGGATMPEGRWRIRSCTVNRWGASPLLFTTKVGDTRQRYGRPLYVLYDHVNTLLSLALQRL